MTENSHFSLANRKLKRFVSLAKRRSENRDSIKIY